MAPDSCTFPHRTATDLPLPGAGLAGTPAREGQASLGRGHAARYTDLVRSDTDPSNERAVRAWRRAGFSDCSPAQGKTGPAPVLRSAPSSW
ncbi:MAG: hypothetical protein A2092_11885 [Rhodobacteraceae bacterium GWE1_64_9]|nr:MAG: hypothetical protein A2092_11885 [Rhodobacteraceae bacterium GWE1_64_9]